MDVRQASRPLSNHPSYNRLQAHQIAVDKVLNGRQARNSDQFPYELQGATVTMEAHSECTSRSRRVAALDASLLMQTPDNFC